jgi:hypothetical protein
MSAIKIVGVVKKEEDQEKGEDLEVATERDPREKQEQMDQHFHTDLRGKMKKGQTIKNLTGNETKAMKGKEEKINHQKTLETLKNWIWK